MSLVSRRANFTFVAGAALVTTGITFAFGAPGAGARPAAAPPGHGKAPAAVNGDNGTVKIHNSSTPVTDRRNEPHVCVFYLDAFGLTRASPCPGRLSRGRRPVTAPLSIRAR